MKNLSYKTPKQYIDELRSVHSKRTVALIDDDLKFDEEILGAYLPDTTVFHVIRKKGTIIFEQEDVQKSDFLTKMLSYYFEAGDIVKCYKILVESSSRLLVTDHEKDTFFDMIMNIKEEETVHE